VTKRAEDLTDAELGELNCRLGWICGTRDQKGRIVGSRKRMYELPDRRFVLAEKSLGIAGKSVVEFGCLEGCHTVSLAGKAKSVIAVDYQPDNLEKSRVRCELYGVSADFRRMDLENELPPAADLFFHSGVLYHLKDPVTHLHRIAPLCRELFLDTHHTAAADARYKAQVDGKTYACRVYGEPKDPRAGAGGFSRWLGLGQIMAILSGHFDRVAILRNDNERNGPRVSIAARKDA
jgi:tRNA (mo5U34)-methyltransferase